MGRIHSLAAVRPHYAWDNQLEPVLEVQSGDSIEAETIDTSDRYYGPGSTVDDARRKPPFRGHPLTGPIRVAGAQPGDVLAVRVREVQPGSWGYTSIIPGLGLLPEDFAQHCLTIWDLADGRRARCPSGHAVPLQPFCGVLGVAPSQSGSHSTTPPRRTGGNMDIRQLVAGTTVYLPVEVPGALFSLGDAHAAQGDGEVCTNAIEMPSVTRVTLDIDAGRAIHEPEIRLPAMPSAYEGSEWYATTASAEDMLQASKSAVRYLIKHLVGTYSLDPVDAYMLCSVAADLRVSQIVNRPNITVSAFFPLSVVK